MKSNFKPELLAPAGDEESFYAAVNAGADAVYLGLLSFNAREKATNFTPETLARITSYAHLLGVKIYVTVNTLVKTDEMDAWLLAVKSAVNAGVDAFIVQDLGAATVLKSVFPDAVLHASTQMGVGNEEGAKILKSFGFSRVVLARETRLKDVEKITKIEGLDVEFFTQGALCVAFSGNCYLSSLTLGRSGNRGACAQLCRLPYEKNGARGAFLSPRDLCLAKSADDLLKAGVKSFKIEGRLKRPAYVYAATRAWREFLDGNISATDVENRIKKIFSRGEYNETAYLHGANRIVDPVNYRHVGERIGEITGKKPFKSLFRYELKTNTELHAGDGLLFFDGKTGECSVGVGNVEKTDKGWAFFSTEEKIRVGAAAYRTVNAEYERKLLKNTRRLPLSLSFYAVAGETPSLTATVFGMTETVSSDTVVQPAKTAPLTEENAKKHLVINAEPFETAEFTATLQNAFLPVFVLNKLKNDLLNKIKKRLLLLNASPMQEKIATWKTANPNPPAIKKTGDGYAVVSSPLDVRKLGEKVPLNLAGIFAPEDFGEDAVSSAVKIAERFLKKPLYIRLPVFATGEEYEKISAFLEKVNGKTPVGVLAENWYALSFLNTYPVIAGAGLNAYNAFTVNALFCLGVKDVIKSYETDEDLGLTYSGSVPLMTVHHCVKKNENPAACLTCDGSLPRLTGMRGATFYLRRTKIIDCRFELMKEKETGESLPKLTGGTVADLRDER